MNDRPAAPAGSGLHRTVLAAAVAGSALLAAGAALADTAGGSGSRMPAGGAFMSSYTTGPYASERQAPAAEPSATGALAPFGPPPRRGPRRFPHRR